MIWFCTCADFTSQADTTGLNVSFTSSITGPLTNLHWDFGDGTTSASINPAHHYTTAGKYYVCLDANGSGCSSTKCDSITVSDFTGIENLRDRIFDLKVYPNPFNAQTNIEYELRAPAEIKIEIFSIIGKRVALFGNGIEPAGKHHLTWNAGEVSAGVYLLRLSVNGEKYNHRLHVIR